MDKILQSLQYAIRGARVDDIAPLASLMRDEDKDEVWASSHHRPQEALAESMAQSVISFTLTVRGRPAAMFGVYPGGLVGQRAMVWALTAKECDKMPIAFVKLSRLAVGRLLGLYPVLENYVDARYTRAIAWLRLLGAEFDPPAPLGPEELPFYHFYLRRGCLDRGRGNRTKLGQ